MELSVFTFCFSIEEYNVFVTMKFFPHVDVVVADGTLDHFDQNTQGFSNVDT